MPTTIPKGSVVRTVRVAMTRFFQRPGVRSTVSKLDNLNGKLWGPSNDGAAHAAASLGAAKPHITSVFPTDRPVVSNTSLMVAASGAAAGAVTPPSLPQLDKLESVLEADVAKAQTTLAALKTASGNKMQGRAAFKSESKLKNMLKLLLPGSLAAAAPAVASLFGSSVVGEAAYWVSKLPLIDIPLGRVIIGNLNFAQPISIAINFALGTLVGLGLYINSRNKQAQALLGEQNTAIETAQEAIRQLFNKDEEKNGLAAILSEEDLLFLTTQQMLEQAQIDELTNKATPHLESQIRTEYTNNKEAFARRLLVARANGRDAQVTIIKEKLEAAQRTELETIMDALRYFDALEQKRAANEAIDPDDLNQKLADWKAIEDTPVYKRLKKTSDILAKSVEALAYHVQLVETQSKGGAIEEAELIAKLAEFKPLLENTRVYKDLQKIKKDLDAAKTHFFDTEILEVDRILKAVYAGDKAGLTSARKDLASLLAKKEKLDKIEAGKRTADEDRLAGEIPGRVSSLEQRIKEIEDKLKLDTRLGEHSKYTIVDKLGGGGFGTVYRAINSVGKPVALKVIKLDVLVKLWSEKLQPATVIENVRQFLLRFEQEYTIGGMTLHPNICRAVDTNIYKVLPDIKDEATFAVTLSKKSHLDALLKGEDIFIVTDLIAAQEGSEESAPSLSNVIKDSHGGIAEHRARKLFAEVFKAFAALHSRKVSHRDIKPENFVVTTDDRGKEHIIVIDLGIAKDATRDEDLTRASEGLGSELYNPPGLYLLKGKQNSEAFALTDIYQLGLVLLETLTGENPFRDKMDATQREEYFKLPTADPTLIAHINETIGKVASEELRKLIKKMLSPNPNDNFQSMDEVIAAFNGGSDPGTKATKAAKKGTPADPGKIVGGRRPSPPPRKKKDKKKKKSKLDIKPPIDISTPAGAIQRLQAIQLKALTDKGLTEDQLDKLNKEVLEIMDKHSADANIVNIAGLTGSQIEEKLEEQE